MGRRPVSGTGQQATDIKFNGHLIERPFDRTYTVWTQTIRSVDAKLAFRVGIMSIDPNSILQLQSSFNAVHRYQTDMCRFHSFNHSQT